MSQLPPEAAALVEAARIGHNPSEADRERVQALLFAALMPPAAASEPRLDSGANRASQAPASMSPASSFAGVGAKLVVVATLALGGVGLWTALKTPSARNGELGPFAASAPSAVGAVQPPPPRLHEAATAVTPLLSTQPSVAMPEEKAPPSRPLEVARKRSASRPRAVSKPLSAEARSAGTDAASAVQPDEPASAASAASASSVSSASSASSVHPSAIGELLLMRRALSALNAGSAEAALRALAEHRASYPLGALLSEREGLYALALCASGQIEAGSRQRTAFLRQFGDSPIATRVRGACQGDSDR